MIFVGVYNKTLANESTRTVYSVKGTHRLLGVKTSTDLSILELNEEIKFTEHVRPVCLLASTQETVPPPGNYDNHSDNTIYNLTEPTLLLLVYNTWSS